MKTELQCACCGSYVGRYEQHWNRDSGYGSCEKCYMDVWRKEGIDSALSQYGIPGHNTKRFAFLGSGPGNGVSLHDAHRIGAYAHKQGLDETKNPFKVPGILVEVETLWDSFNHAVNGGTWADYEVRVTGEQT